MHKFVRNLLTEWRKLKLPFENETILIAVSGGADSAALALALHDLCEAKKLKLNFVVAHFNHNLRGAESDADAEFVKNLAKKLNFDFICGIQNPESKIQNQKGNLEQSARQARYKFLRETAENLDAVAVLTAHTVNDQAETFLLRLMRGSGADGLGAMRQVRNLEGGRRKTEDRRQKTESKEQKAEFKIIKRQSEAQNPKSQILLARPLLSWAQREATENFAREKEINFRVDSMNADEKFSRVKVRKKLIPLLREFNPKIVETLAQTAFLLQKDAEHLALNIYHLPENPAVKDLQPLSKSTLYGVLRDWLKTVRGDLRQIELKHIEAIGRLILSRRSGRKIELPDGGAVIKKHGKIIFEKTRVEKSRSDN
ncbi:MAG: tRNA lysidine(34) synthetase TilS [Pyrinomonadaceae bacterium]